MTSSMSGKVVVVSGGARGVGRCAAEEFARAGATLVVTDADGLALEEAAALLRGWGPEVTAFTLDPWDRVAVENMATEVLERHGGVDVLVNHAGEAQGGALAETTLGTWSHLVDVNFWGPLFHVYAFLPSMRQRGRGHIVNVSSGGAVSRVPGWGAYATVKVALGAFSEALGEEMAPHGIAVTTVYPALAEPAAPTGGQGLAARVSGTLRALYADSPKKVGRRIFHAVRETKTGATAGRLKTRRRRERGVPGLAPAMDRVTTWLSGTPH
jgi:NAD(P)-dependent dehydrogenase (short-subunit alcohol dehydrogenase family)